MRRRLHRIRGADGARGARAACVGKSRRRSHPPGGGRSPPLPRSTRPVVEHAPPGTASRWHRSASSPCQQVRRERTPRDAAFGDCSTLPGGRFRGASDADNFLSGNDGADTLLGGLGDDSLAGDAGDDTPAGGTGADVLTGGVRNDRPGGAAGLRLPGPGLELGGGSDGGRP
ncbi:calcium-binding protein, partial [Falsiroseomonas sp.]|uniref:calcium-binding protein n=1 Tax=Falsiroseomonas sp. TaxID=2870721 RepID=UPI003F70E136